MAGAKSDDWVEILERLAGGDCAALARVARLVTGRLARLGAYDIRDDWDDIVQDVVITVMGAYQSGTIDSSPQIQKFIWTTTWHKYRHVIDDTWRRRRRDLTRPGDEEDADEAALRPGDGLEGDARSVEVLYEFVDLVDQIEDEEARSLLLAHVVEGRSYDELAHGAVVARATVVRRIRAARQALRELYEHGEPPGAPA